MHGHDDINCQTHFNTDSGASKASGSADQTNEFGGVDLLDARLENLSMQRQEKAAH